MKTTETSHAFYNLKDFPRVAMTMEDWMVKLSKVLNELAQKNNIVLTEPIVILPLVEKDPL
jgi:hypothetical protein